MPPHVGSPESKKLTVIIPFDVFAVDLAGGSCDLQQGRESKYIKSVDQAKGQWAKWDSQGAL